MQPSSLQITDERIYSLYIPLNNSFSRRIDLILTKKKKTWNCRLVNGSGDENFTCRVLKTAMQKKKKNK